MVTPLITIKGWFLLFFSFLPSLKTIIPCMIFLAYDRMLFTGSWEMIHDWFWNLCCANKRSALGCVLISSLPDSLLIADLWWVLHLLRGWDTILYCFLSVLSCNPWLILHLVVSCFLSVLSDNPWFILPLVEFWVMIPDCFLSVLSDNPWFILDLVEFWVMIPDWFLSVLSDNPWIILHLVEFWVMIPDCFLSVLTEW